VDDTLGVFADIGLVSNQEDGITLRHQLVKDLHDIGRGLRVYESLRSH